MDLANRLPKTGDNHLIVDGGSNFGINVYVTEADWIVWKDALGLSLDYPGVDTTKRVDAAILLIDGLPANSKKAGQVFSDVAPTDWYYDGVMSMYNLGLVRGYEDGTFKPELELSAVSLAIFTAIQKGISYPPAEWENTINNEEICAYFPGNPVENTKEAAAYAILKMFNVDTSNINGDAADAILAKFGDHDSISASCKQALAYLVSIGALKGDENNNLNPKGTLTRGAFAVFYTRVQNGLDLSKMKDYMDTVEAAE
jgi:hypothetical protein